MPAESLGPKSLQQTSDIALRTVQHLEVDLDPVLENVK